MKRGFLKGGFDKPKTSTSPSSKKGDTTEETKSDDEGITPPVHKGSASDGPGKTKNYQDKQQELTLKERLQGMTPASPAVAAGLPRAPQLCIIGFGTGDNEWDTIVVTELTNRTTLREHPQFEKCRSRELEFFNAVSARIEPIEGKGISLMARRDMKPGTLFVCERPLIVMPHYWSVEMVETCEKWIDLFQPHKKAAFYRLFNCKPRGRGMVEAVSIIRTNAIEAKLPFDERVHTATFELISRANHSCTPNAVYYFNYSTFCGELVAATDIKAGDEITISYVNILRPAVERKAELQEKYLFTCDCKACDASSPTFADSEERRDTIVQSTPGAMPKPGRGISIPANGYDDAYIQRLLDLYDAEGLFELKARALEFFVMWERTNAEYSGDWRRTLEMTRRAMEEVKRLKGAGKSDTWAYLKRVEEEATNPAVRVKKKPQVFNPVGSNPFAKVMEDKSFMNFNAEDLEKQMGGTRVVQDDSFMNDMSKKGQAFLDKHSPEEQEKIMQKMKDLMEQMASGGPGLFMFEPDGKITKASLDT